MPHPQRRHNPTPIAGVLQLTQVMHLSNTYLMDLAPPRVVLNYICGCLKFQIHWPSRYPLRAPPTMGNHYHYVEVDLFSSILPTYRARAIGWGRKSLGTTGVFYPSYGTKYFKLDAVNSISTILHLPESKSSSESSCLVDMNSSIKFFLAINYKLAINEWRLMRRLDRSSHRQACGPG